jgi:hypothetical protein
MKAERAERLAVQAAVDGFAAHSANAPVLAESFRSALQRSRQRETPRQEESRKQSRGRERASSNGHCTTEPGRERSAAALLPADGVAPDGVPSGALRACGLITTPKLDTSQRTASPAAQHEVSRPRRSGNEKGSCVEVVHSRTGTRFLLSREGDVWLLALASPVESRSAELESLASALNAQFAARGLGQVDILFH